MSSAVGRRVLGVSAAILAAMGVLVLPARFISVSVRDEARKRSRMATGNTRLGPPMRGALSLAV